MDPRLPEQRLVGTWQGICTPPIGFPTHLALIFRADGTFTLTAQILGEPKMTYSGTWSYKDGSLTLESPLGIEEDVITWLNDNRFRAFCVRCSLPAAEGVEWICTRVK